MKSIVFVTHWGSEAGAFGFTNKLPFMGGVWWIVFLLIAMLIVGAAYLLILKLLKKKAYSGKNNI